MPISKITDRSAVDAAISEFERLGRDAFLAKYGFGRAKRYFVKGTDGALIDSKALAGVAYGYQFPDQGPLKYDQFSGGEVSVKQELERLGYEVVQLDPSERPASPRIWVEVTLVRGRSDRTAGPHQLGQALWSPQRSADDRDIYANMRQVRRGDVILHLTDNEGITAVSQAAGSVDDTFMGVSGTPWGDRPCYRISLERFARLDPPLDRAWFFEDPSISSELAAIAEQPRGHGLFYSKKMELNQGAYLTEAPSALALALNRAYQNHTGKSVPLLGEALDVLLNASTEETGRITSSDIRELQKSREKQRYKDLGRELINAQP